MEHIQQWVAECQGRLVPKFRLGRYCQACCTDCTPAAGSEKSLSASSPTRLCCVSFSQCGVCIGSLLWFYSVTAFVMVRFSPFHGASRCLITSLGKCLSKALVHFLLVAFFLLICRGSLYNWHASHSAMFACVLTLLAMS